MIRLSNGHEFEHMTSSSAMGYFGKGWLHERFLHFLSWLLSRIKPSWEFFNPSLSTNVAKTVTWPGRKGNFKWYWPWGCIRPIFEGNRIPFSFWECARYFFQGLKITGALNAVGLTNKGPAWWTTGCLKRGITKEDSLVGSVLAEGNDSEIEEKLSYMFNLLDDVNLVAVVVNMSCSNTRGNVLTAFKKIIEVCREEKERGNIRHPLIAKLSVIHMPCLNQILTMMEGVFEAITINSIKFNLVFPGEVSPLFHLGDGAVSGKVAQEMNWDFANMIKNKTNTPVVFPIWDYDDIAKARDRGADAFNYSSVSLWFPWRFTKYVLQDMKERSK